MEIKAQARNKLVRLIKNNLSIYKKQVITLTSLCKQMMSMRSILMFKKLYAIRSLNNVILNALKNVVENINQPFSRIYMDAKKTIVAIKYLAN